MRTWFLFLLIISVVVFADVPHLISYQGRLTDDVTGDPVLDDDYSITFRLYEVVSGGTAIWTENHSAVPVIGGIYSVMLGSSTAFLGHVSFEDPLWLEVQVGATTLSPRYQLGSSPYALNIADLIIKDNDQSFATDMRLTSGVDGDRKIYFGDGYYVGIGEYGGRDDQMLIDVADDSIFIKSKGLFPTDMYTDLGSVDHEWTDVYIDRRLYINGSAPNNKFLGSDGTGFLEWKDLPGGDDGDWTISGSNMYSAVTGNVGIGTTGPTDGKLHINGSSCFGNGLYIENSFFDGIMVEYPGDDGIHIHKPGDDGIQIDSAAGYGIWVREADMHGIRVSDAGDDGILIDSPGDDGVEITNAGADGVSIDSASLDGVNIYYSGIDGVYIYSTGDDGVHVSNTGGDGIFVCYSTDYDGYFDSDIYAAIANAGIKAFLIDHPSDPEHKLLRHYSVESPKVMLNYPGVVQIDADGTGMVTMPEYFADLVDEDGVMIQLTSIGRPFMSGYDWDARNCTATIYGEPNREVAYVVFAERDDPVKRYLEQPVESFKADGKYCPDGQLLIPAAYGYPDNMRRGYEKQREGRERKTRQNK